MSNFVSLGQYRSRIESISGGIAVIIPARRNYFIAAFLCVWLGGWFMGETGAIDQLLHPAAMQNHAPDTFLAFWLCGWSLGGAFALTSLLWLIGGRERIAVHHDAFSIRREVFGIGWNWPYELRSVKNLRTLESNGSGTSAFGYRSRNPFGWSGGPLAFDYGARTVRFGAGVDVAEAKYLLSKMIAAKPALTHS